MNLNSEQNAAFMNDPRRAGGRVSDEQGQWIEALRKQGYRVEVCKGWEAAAAVIAEYLGPGKEDPWE